MIPWKAEIKEDDKIFPTKEEFDKHQTWYNWKKIFRPLEGQEVELWVRTGYCEESIEVWCHALKDFFESHHQDIPEAEKIVKEWLTTILIEEHKEIEDYECNMYEHGPIPGWHKAPDGGESFFVQADYYHSVYPDD